jgi:16S rRNA (cytosine967-C5)-methyltransferase
LYHLSHLATAKQLLLGYKPQCPLNLYLKTYFGQNKKHGSKDRKLISALCYNYFRLGFAVKNISIEEGILIGIFLCEPSHSDILNFFKPEWNKMISSPPEEKLTQLSLGDQINIFPFEDELSNEIDPERFNISFLKQPKLFIRIRPGYENIVPAKLQGTGIPYKTMSQSCIALPNSSKIHEVIELDKEAVVQDYNSQKVGDLIKLATPDPLSEITVWDCCAASGGKSIMTYDINPAIQLTVSDKRESIIQNLRRRFTNAGIKNYNAFIADLAARSQAQVTEKFDLIIADVPCTGSGTWSRTPEQLYYFNQNQIKRYCDQQKKIVENVLPYLKAGGWFLYITCSVFKKENEDVVNFIKEKFKLNIVKSELLKGYEIEADTMFAALFKAA